MHVKNSKDGLDKALKELKRKTIQVRQVKELRERDHFTKPSVKKRETKKKALYKQRMYSQSEYSSQ